MMLSSSPTDCCFSSPEEVKKVASTVRSEVGEVDVLINNAGIVNGKRLLELTNGAISKTIGVNLLAQMWVSAVCSQLDLENTPWGRIRHTKHHTIDFQILC